MGESQGNSAYFFSVIVAGLAHFFAANSAGLVQEPMVLEQVYFFFSLCAQWFKFFFFIRLTALRRTTFQLRKLHEPALREGALFVMGRAWRRRTRRGFARSSRVRLF
jgi:hypothetical protein